MDAPHGFAPLDDPGGFVSHAGPLLVREGVVGVRVEEHHLNRAGTVMGGFFATLADAAFGRAIREEVDADRIATVSLTTDFLGPARAGAWLEATTAVERAGGHLAFADCSITADGEPVVRARAVFAVLE